MAVTASASSPRVLPADSARLYAPLTVSFQGQTMQLHQAAETLLTSLHGSNSYGGYTPEQVFTGFLLYSDDWQAEPIIRVEGDSLRTVLHLQPYASVNDFFNTDYILGPLVQAFYNGAQDSLCQQAVVIDSRLMMVMELLDPHYRNAFKQLSVANPTEHTSNTLSSVLLIAVIILALATAMIVLRKKAK